jgi:hypothetical protein
MAWHITAGANDAGELAAEDGCDAEALAQLRPTCCRPPRRRIAWQHLREAVSSEAKENPVPEDAAGGWAPAYPH